MCERFKSLLGFRANEWRQPEFLSVPTMTPISKHLKLSLTKPIAVSDLKMPVFTNHQTHITVKTLLETQAASLHRIMTTLF